MKIGVNKEQVLDLIIAWLAGIPMSPILILFSLIGLGVGVFMAINPHLSIEIQRRFYEKINWRIEPISMPKEIRNTRMMGGFLLLAVVAALILFFI